MVISPDNKINKHAWECALLTKVRNEIKSGNLLVKNSKRYGPFDSFFISKDQWGGMREQFFAQSALPASCKQAEVYLTQRLNSAFDLFQKSAPENTYAQVDGDRWDLSVDRSDPLDPTVFVKLQQFKDWVKKHQRHVRLPQLLIEVDNDLKFTRSFLPLTQNQSRPAQEIWAIIAAVMAHGCNIGPDTMARLTQEVTYQQIKRITDWQLTQETQRSALGTVVNAIANLDITKTWGEGKTSASDGQRFAFRRKVQWQTYSHKFRDFALEFYSFVADNYAPFYSVPIECNERDAPYVLDGLLYNETDMELYHFQLKTSRFFELICSRKIATPRVNQLSPKKVRTRWADFQKGVKTCSISLSMASRVGKTVFATWRLTISHIVSIGFSSGQ